jgi:hypothetical protein
LFEKLLMARRKQNLVAQRTPKATENTREYQFDAVVSLSE